MHISKNSNTFAADINEELFKSIFYILAIRYYSQINKKCLTIKFLKL